MLSLIPTLHQRQPTDATGLYPKLGGLPWGLSTSLWPVCTECGQAMSPVAQLPVRGTLDQLGPLKDRSDVADMVLHLFKCEGDDVCSFWDADIGTNAAFFVPRSELGEGLTPLPEEQTLLLPELWVTGWKPFEDPLPEHMVEAASDTTQWMNELTDEMRFPTSQRTKLGGAPWWTGNGPQRVPDAPQTYLLQLDQFMHVEDGKHDVDFGNLCSDGTCYVYVDPESLRASMFINR